MASVPPAPIVVAASLTTASIVGALHLAFGDSDNFSGGATALVATGMIVLALVAVSGVLLARGRWAQPTAAVVAIGWIAIVAPTALDWVSGLALTAAAVALAGSIGPWLRRWVRHRPAAQGPPPAAVAALLLLLSVPVAVGVTVTDAVPWQAWALAAWSLTVTLALARAIPGALIAIRLLHAPACVIVGASMSVAGLILVGGLGVAAAAFAWRREVAVAVAPVHDRSGGVLRIPPELAPPEVLDVAGADESGQRHQ